MWNNGESYEGDFFDDLRHGHGVYTFESGTYY